MYNIEEKIFFIFFSFFYDSFKIEKKRGGKKCWVVNILCLEME